MQIKKDVAFAIDMSIIKQQSHSVKWMKSSKLG